MEGADEIFALRGIDAGFAANRAVNLRQQRGGDLHEIHAAAQDTGGKTGEITDNTAAKGDDQIAALDFHGQKFFAGPGKRSEILRRFSGGQDDYIMRQPGPVEAFLQLFEMQSGDILIGDDGAFSLPKPG